jgi:metal-responsive CopG/Arc/MetJ family transcriptional regulator
MPKTKIAVSIDPGVLARLDDLVEEAGFRSRSHAVEAAVQEKLERLERTRLARECAMLDPAFEKALAEEGLAGDVVEWPTY